MPLYSLKRTTDPASSPISLSDMKDHLRIDGTDEDTLIQSYIDSATAHVEEVGRTGLVTQSWTVRIPCWVEEIKLPRGPVASVTEITYYDSTGSEVTLSTDVYELLDTFPHRIVRKPGQSWPSVESGRALPIGIEFVCGSAVADVNPQALAAIRLLVGHWFENREASVHAGAAPKSIPLGVERLLYQIRTVEL